MKALYRNKAFPKLLYLMIFFLIKDFEMRITKIGVFSLHCSPWEEKAMAPHSSTLAWKIPWTKEPGRLQSMGSLKSQTRLSNFTFMHWRRKWQPAPVFLPGKSQGRGSLVSCHLWGRTQSDTTEATQQQQSLEGTVKYDSITSVLASS